MAEPLEAQARLDEIVRQIAANMVAEVCSLYVLRADGVLELYATQGLNPGSVHLAQLRLGEGSRPGIERLQRVDQHDLAIEPRDVLAKERLHHVCLVGFVASLHHRVKRATLR